MESKQMDAIESKELRGLSLKSLALIIGSTVTICVTVLTAFYSVREGVGELKTELKTDVNEVSGQIKMQELSRKEYEKFDELRYRTLELRIGILEQQVNKDQKTN